MTAYFGGGASNSGGISGYDKNGNFKQRVFDGPINGNPTDARTQYLKKKITIPEGVYFIAFSSHIGGSYPIELKIQTIIDPTLLLKNVDLLDEKHIYQEELQSSIESVETVLKSSNQPMLTFAVFTDLHHDPKYPNDPTIDMFANMEKLNNQLHFDGIFNLGDTIDGQFQTKYVAEECIADVTGLMYNISLIKSHSVTGNHDDNVQSTWPDRGGLDVSNRLTNL